MRGGARLLAVLAGLSAGCGGERGPAVVAGDVFVVLDTGEEVDAAGVPVRLLLDRPQTDTLLARICAERRELLAEAAADPETLAGVQGWAWEKRAELLAGTTRAAITTGPDARFRFDSVPAGRYRVWVEARVQGERWGWMEPVEARAGDSLYLTLANHNADGDPFRCDLLRDMEADASG